MPLTLRANLNRPLTYQEADANFTYVEGLGTAAQQAAQTAQAGADASVKTSSKGQANGVASLDANAKVPSAQMPNSDSVSEGTSNAYFTQPRVRGTPLTGLPTPADSGISATDTVLSAFSKLQGQITAVVQAVVSNAQNLAANVRGTVLSGFSPSARSDLNATDTVLTALQKLQGMNADLIKTTSTTDATAGRLLKAGDFGIGGPAIVLASNISWDTITTPGKYYINAATGTNTPLSGLNCFLEVFSTGDNRFKQVAYQLGNGAQYSRVFSSTWSVWDRSVTQLNLLGTVSQAAGVPTGAIIETGTNANGTYTKYADGTMICSGISPGSVTANTQGGSIYYSQAVTFTFPAAFVGGVPKISHGPLTTTNYFCWTAYEGTANLTNTQFLRLISPVNNSTGYICYTAIGRWF